MIFPDFCEAMTWSGTAGLVISGNPHVRLVGFNVIADSSAGPGAPLVAFDRSASGSGQALFRNTAVAASQVVFPPVPVRCGGIYMDTLDASLTGAAVVIYYIPNK